MRLAGLCLDAVRLCHGDAFAAADRLAAALPVWRTLRAEAGGLLEVRVVVRQGRLVVVAGGRCVTLSPVRVAPPEWQEIGARLRAESESQDGALLAARNREMARIAAEQARALEDLQAGLAEKRAALAAATQAADTDPLTGLGNRRAYETALRQALEAAHDQGAPFALLFLDLDHFKAINDTEGHAGGDRHLRGVADVLRTVLSAGGTGSGFAYRTGGDEFAVILNALPGPAWDVAQMIIEGLAGAVSLGLTVYRKGDDAQSLALRADQALYEAKRAGRGRTERA